MQDVYPNILKMTTPTSLLAINKEWSEYAKNKIIDMLSDYIYVEDIDKWSDLSFSLTINDELHELNNIMIIFNVHNDEVVLDDKNGALINMHQENEYELDLPEFEYELNFLNETYDIYRIMYTYYNAFLNNYFDEIEVDLGIKVNTDFINNYVEIMFDENTVERVILKRIKLLGVSQSYLQPSIDKYYSKLKGSLIILEESHEQFLIDIYGE